MNVRSLRYLVPAVAVGLALSCAKSNPASPSSGSTSSIGAPQPASPANAAQIRNIDQPVTLSVANGVITGTASATYTFEVATDPGFNTKVQTKSVAESSNGRTSVTLDMLSSATDYYWHVREAGGGNTGVFGTTYRFTIGPAISLGAPTPVTPLAGTVTSGWPTLVVGDAPRQGPVGAVVYLFEVSANASFSPALYSQNVPESAGQTSWVMPIALPAPTQTTLYWRATAIDSASGVTGPASAAQSFTWAPPTRQAQLAAQEGVVLWPGAQPTGTNGHAQMGDNWNVQQIVSFDGHLFTSPTIDELRIFDLMDRGMSPAAAIDWLNANGYAPYALWYPSPGVIAFQYEYMAPNANGAWDIVVRVGA